MSAVAAVNREQIVNNISGRMSLRQPQKRSLELLARIEELLRLDKSQDLDAALQIAKGELEGFHEFERDFPSFCFALATGVGKTRLMGAFITYLYRTRGFRHFFVLAPNLTIYEKLIKDFTPNTPKYVFQGVSEFAVSPPGLMTGDTYEQTNIDAFDLAHGVVINVFNISKINSEVRGGNAPRIRKLSEYIGTSYFQYLSNLPDLVLLMDESHRYRASAGSRAINELAPVLGLELTATPKATAGGAFKNVVYSYPLGKAMSDGFVKEPAVGTRAGFDAKSYKDDAELDKLKLQDGIRFHENTKAELEVYAKQNDKPLVKPFMLVVARTTEHANELERTIKHKDFFDGRYSDAVATVHSNQSGEIKDENLSNLLAVEDRTNKTEIVIHVNKLGEGWDVTNLYTIVPLRASAAEILTEQTIGRGLRLPYGRRTGVKAIDRLTIVAHDRFQAIIDAANKEDSLIRDQVVIGRDIPEKKMVVTTVKPTYANLLGLDGQPKQPEFVLSSDREKMIGKVVLEVANRLQKPSTSRSLQTEQVRYEIAQKALAGGSDQLVLAEDTDLDEVVAVVKKVTDAMVSKLIDIPRITIVPKENKSASFDDFVLDLSGMNYQPVDQDLIQHGLHSNDQMRIASGEKGPREKLLEDYIVRHLIEFPEIDYGSQFEVLYKFAGQVITHFRGRLTDDDEVANVLISFGRKIAGEVRRQMLEHYREGQTEYIAKVTQGFMTLRDLEISAPEGQPVFLYSNEPQNRSDVPKLTFGGFERCLYPLQRFQSHPELRFARLLERDGDKTLKWLKPAKNQFQIYYKGEHPYEPDFIVETKDEKLICEPKQMSELNDLVVQDKAEAAVRWCQEASKYEQENGGKPWRYVLLPEDEIIDSTNLNALVKRFSH